MATKKRESVYSNGGGVPQCLMCESVGWFEEKKFGGKGIGWFFFGF
jgi:hypothetical protein